jgi:3-deoxy-D-manno-octulosonate 8-phosphate phosphatase (KDO 8-P phosphatase)
MNKNFKQLLNKVRCFIFDVDGVLTDGSLILMQGDQVRTMNIRDGYAMKAAIEAGYNLAIISGGNSPGVRDRLIKLGVIDIYQGVDDKIKSLNEIVSKYNLEDHEILYMGDDLPDYDGMKRSGVPCCPNDAAPEIAEISVYVSHANGGKGCVRDVIEQVMRLHGKWHNA